MNHAILILTALMLAPLEASEPDPKTTALSRDEELLVLDNGTIKIGIDRPKGASIAWLSWAGYPTNIVNSADPRRNSRPST